MNNTSIDISGVDRAELLAALYNGTSPLGFGKNHDLGRDMTVEEAKDILGKTEGKFSFDYLLGRPLKMWIDDTEPNTLQRPDLYDRDSRLPCSQIVNRLKESNGD